MVAREGQERVELVSGLPPQPDDGRVTLAPDVPAYGGPSGTYHFGLRLSTAEVRPHSGIGRRTALAVTRGSARSAADQCVLVLSASSGPDWARVGPGVFRRVSLGVSSGPGARVPRAR